MNDLPLAYLVVWCFVECGGPPSICCSSQIKCSDVVCKNSCKYKLSLLLKKHLIFNHITRVTTQCNMTAMETTYLLRVSDQEEE